MCRVEINNYCIRKDKVMQLKARIEIQFAKETIGKGGGGRGMGRGRRQGKARFALN